MSHQKVRTGFLLAGLTNFCIIIFSRGYSNSLGAIDPHFDTTGCLLITLWGAAYISIARDYARVPWLSIVFGFEKLLYLSRWVLFLARNPDFEAVWETDPLASIFFGVYGFVDGLYSLFFFYAGFTSLKNQDT